MLVAEIAEAELSANDGSVITTVGTKKMASLQMRLQARDERATPELQLV